MVFARIAKIICDAVWFCTLIVTVASLTWRALKEAGDFLSVLVLESCPVGESSGLCKSTNWSLSPSF